MIGAVVRRGGMMRTGTGLKPLAKEKVLGRGAVRKEEVKVIRPVTLDRELVGFAVNQDISPEIAGRNSRTLGKAKVSLDRKVTPKVMGKDSKVRRACMVSNRNGGRPTTCKLTTQI